MVVVMSVASMPTAWVLDGLADLEQRMVDRVASLLLAGFTQVEVRADCALEARAEKRELVAAVTGDIGVDGSALLVKPTRSRRRAVDLQHYMIRGMHAFRLAFTAQIIVEALAAFVADTHDRGDVAAVAADVGMHGFVAGRRRGVRGTSLQVRKEWALETIGGRLDVDFEVDERQQRRDASANQTAAAM